MENYVQLASTPAPFHNKALPIGSLLREWRLESILGVGGFGIVYRAKGLYFNEIVAIKEYFPGAISDRLGDTTVAPTTSSAEQLYALGLEKFLAEAKLLWGLSQPERHPNIVSVRSLFEMHGTAYSVMDFEAGKPLEELLSFGRRFDEAALMRLLRPLAEGLSRAHEAGVVHRDIKPANILIRDDGAPVLIDFGSARFESGEATSASVTFYTPPYAALEQYVRSYAQGPWTDIYALGVVLFQCVTGRTPAEVLERLHAGAGELLADGHWPGFSRTFTRAVDAAIALQPTQRPQSMAEWIALFDQPPAGPNEELTRIQSYLELEVASFADPTQSAAGGSVGASSLKGGGVLQAIALRPRLMAGGTVAIALAALILAATFDRPPKAIVAPPAPAQNITSVGARTKQPSLVAAAVMNSLDQLSAEAAKVGPPQFVSALASASTGIRAQASAIRKVDGRPDAEGRGAHLLPALRAEVAALVQEEIETLSSRADAQAGAAKRFGAGERSEAQADYASFRQLSLALGARSQAMAPADLISAGRQLLDRYGVFDQAFRDVSEQVLPTRRRMFEGQLLRAEATARRIASSGNVSKPWFLAPQQRKAAYQRLQAAAQAARSLQAQLGRLAHRVSAAGSSAELDQGVAQLSAIERQLAAQNSQAGRARAVLR